MQWIRCTAVYAILLSPTTLPASSVFRCEHGDGHITFSQYGCSESQQQRIQDTHNPNPGSVVTPLTRPEPMPKSATEPSEKTLTVIGEQQDGCGNAVIGSARREAIIRKQIRTGMTRKDVESALGKPQRISQRNGQTTYHYTSKDNSERRTVSFDQNDCVMGKR